MKKPIKTGETLYRTIAIRKDDISPDARTVVIALSSETPVQRYFGKEILVHEKGAVNLDFLNSGRAPFLVSHDHNDQIGVVESARLDSDRVLRAVVRFGNSARASEMLQDVKDGIRLNISVGYSIEKYETDEKTETVRCILWRPFEASLVSVPADTAVGVGRSSNTIIGANMNTTVLDNDAVIAQAMADAGVMYDMAARHNIPREKVNAHIKAGKSLTEWRAYVLDNLSSGTPLITLGGDTRTFTEGFDLGKLLRARLTGDYRGAEFEREVSQDLTKAQHGARGMVVPSSALGRAALVTSSTSAPLVGTEHKPELFIDALRASCAVIAAGATVLDGLQQNVSIPKMTTDPAASWTGEVAAITEANPAFAAVTLAPTMLTAHVAYSRKSLLQGLPQLDTMMKMAITSQFGVALDNAAIQGSGTAPVPRGIVNQVGIGAVTGSAGVVTWAQLCDLWNAVIGQNIIPDASMAFLAHPTVASIMRKTEKWTGSGQPLLGDAPVVNRDGTITAGNVLGRPAFETTNSPASKVVLGRFSDLLIGMWSGVDIVIDETSQAANGTIRLFAYLFTDITVKNAKAFACINGI